MAGPDDLLLLLVQHWARDESVFPTEDDRHDVATITLFQSYMRGRPAEFFHSSKGKASQDPSAKQLRLRIKRTLLQTCWHVNIQKLRGWRVVQCISREGFILINLVSNIDK